MIYLFEGDLTKPLDKNLHWKQVLNTIIKRMEADEGAVTGSKIIDILGKTRKEFKDLLEITAGGPGA